MEEKIFFDKPNALSAEFLLAEFNALQDRAISLEEIKSGRLNFFLLITGAVTAGLSSLYGNPAFVSIYLPAILISAFVLLLLGLLTLKSVVDYSIAIVILYRRAGRIRRWFVEHDKSITKYVAFEPADDYPKMSMPFSLLSWRGGEPVLMILNMVSASILVGISLTFFQFNISPWVGAIIVALLAWFSQNWYIARKLNKQELVEKKRVFFPLN